MPYPFLFDAQRSFITSGGYCPVEDVDALFKNIAGYSTLDTDEKNRRIADAAVEIDRSLETKYLVPVTGDTNALSILRLINSRLAAAIIGEVYYREAQPNAAPQIEVWRTFAELLLKDIDDGIIRFFSATLATTNDLPQFPPGAGATFNDDNDQDINFDQQPIYQRGGRGNLSSLGDLI